MRTEKNIFGMGLNYSMRKTKSPSFDAYVSALHKEMQKYGNVNPHKSDELKFLTDKADAFLRKHAGISYEDFLRQAKLEEFTGDGYKNLQDAEQKRKLFRNRTGAYLAALADVEERGYDIGEVLKDLRDSKIEGLEQTEKELILRQLSLKQNSYSIQPVQKRFGRYTVELRLPDESEDWDLERERLQVNVTSDQGEDYYADFVTFDYIKGIMKEKFPEAGNGNYFPGRDRIIVRDLDESTINQTLEDILLNYNYRLEDYFKKI